MTAAETSVTDDEMARARWDENMAKAVAAVKDGAYNATRTAQASTDAYRAWERADAAARDAYQAFDDAKRTLTGIVNSPPRSAS